MSGAFVRRQQFYHLPQTDVSDSNQKNKEVSAYGECNT